MQGSARQGRTPENDKRVSALKIPSAANLKGYCLDILIESFVVGEVVAVLDKSGRLEAEIKGWIPRPPSSE